MYICTYYRQKYSIYANEKCLNVRTYLVICLVYRDAFSIVIIDVVILLTLDLKINLVGNLLLIIWYIFKKLDDMKSWKTIWSQIPFLFFLTNFVLFLNIKINQSDWKGSFIKNQINRLLGLLVVVGDPILDLWILGPWRRSLLSLSAI